MSEMTPETSPYQNYNQGAVVAGGHTQALTGEVASLALGLGGVRAAARGVGAEFQQMTSGIAASAKVTHQSTAQLSGSIRALSRDFPLARQEAVATERAVMALGLTAKGQERQVASLAVTMTKLGGAVGEAPSQMAAGFGQLTREMSSLDPTRVSRFADVLVASSARSGASASSITSFAKAIGPMAQAAGVGEASVLGISTSFAKLGDDGYVAANAVSKMFNDLNRAVHDGSNDMAGYANAVGMTIDQFKALYTADPARAIAQVTQAVGKMPSGQASRTLEELGITSQRAQRAFLEQAQSGGMMADINAARQAYGSGVTNQASQAGFNTVLNSLQRLSSAAEDVALTFERPLLHSVNSIINLAGGATRGIGTVMRTGPIGDVVSLIGQAALPLLVARMGVKAVNTGALASFLLRSGPITGGLAGFATGRMAKGGLTAEEAAAAALEHGPRTQAVSDMLLAASTGNQMGTNPFRARLNQGVYNVGAGIGALFPRGQGGANLLRVGLGAGVQGAGVAMRLQSELFRQARMSPLERDTMAMRPVAGPAEQFIRDYQARSEQVSKGTLTMGEHISATAGGLKGLAEESGHARVAIRTLSGGFVELAKQFVLTGGAGGLAIGKGLLGGIAGLARGPMGIAAAGYLGYSLYQGSKGEQAREADRVNNLTGFDAVNSYRDALGKTGEATIKLSDQINAASQTMLLAVNNFHDAAQISSSDYQEINRHKNVSQYFSGSGAQVAAQVGAMDLGGLQPSDVQGAKLDLMRLKQQGKLPAGFDITAALSGVQPNSSQTMSGSQITDFVTGMANAPGLSQTSGFGDWFRRNASVHIGTRGVSFGGTSREMWEQLGHPGHGSPRLGKAATSELSLLQDALMQERQNLGDKYTDQYAAGRQVQDMDKAMSSALHSHNADLVVGMEQAFTTQLGKRITGVSAKQIADAGGFVKFLEKRKIKIDGMTVDALLGGAKQTPDMVENGLSTSLQTNVGRVGAFFSNFNAGPLEAGRKALASAALSPDDVQKQHDAAMTIVDSGTKAGMSLGDLAAQAAKSTASMADGDARRAVMNQVIAEATRRLQNSLAGMNFGQQIAAQGNFAGKLAGVTGNTPEAQQARQQGQDSATQTLQAERSYMQQRLQAQYDFEKQSSRSWRDYNRQVLYTNQEHTRQLQRQAQDAAKSMYDPYQRIQVMPVWDAGNLIENSQEQIGAMRQQLRNIHRLKDLGMTDATIQMLGLYDPQKAQQALELAADLQHNQGQVRILNQQTRERTSLAGSLITQDPQYKRQQQDFKIAMGQQAVAFKTQMADARRDLTDSDREMTGDLTTLQADMNKILHGQQVDWSTSLVNNLANTITTIKHWTPKLLDAQAGAVYNAGGSGSGFGPGPGYGAGNRQFTGTPDTASHAPTHRIASGVNKGYLATGASTPGTDMETFGNKPLHWGKNVAVAPDNRRLTPNAKLAQKMAKDYGWDAGVEWAALFQIWQQESGFSTSAGSPKKAYGIPQADPGDKMATFGSDWRSNPRTQIGWGLDYIWHSYGDPLGAWAHKARTGWYGQGGIATKPHLGVVAEMGSPEAMIPLNAQGISVLAQALREAAQSNADDLSILRGGGASYAIHISNDQYFYDSGQHIHGPVTVKANSPAEWAAAAHTTSRRNNLTAARSVGWSRSAA